jgi:hypothetical protein
VCNVNYRREKSMKKFLICIICLLLVLICFIVSSFVSKVNAASNFTASSYKIDGKYILDIPPYLTVSNFESVVSESTVETDTNVNNYVKTGDTVHIGSKSYTAIVLGDVNINSDGHGDGKCNYKDVLREQEIIDSLK